MTTARELQLEAALRGVLATFRLSVAPNMPGSHFPQVEHAEKVLGAAPAQPRPSAIEVLHALEGLGWLNDDLGHSKLLRKACADGRALVGQYLKD